MRAAGRTAKDLVCGMDVDTKDPHAIKVQHSGTTYFFCSEKCKRDFEAAPDKYIPKEQVAVGSGGGRGV